MFLIDIFFLQSTSLVLKRNMKNGHNSILLSHGMLSGGGTTTYLLRMFHHKKHTSKKEKSIKLKKNTKQAFLVF